MKRQEAYALFHKKSDLVSFIQFPRIFQGVRLPEYYSLHTMSQNRKNRLAAPLTTSRSKQHSPGLLKECHEMPMSRKLHFVRFFFQST